jgi:asparagine synthetase B (glutamine-hydrolysing)
MLIRDGRGKWVMRNALSNALPDTVRLAAKRGVQSPQREWFRDGYLARVLKRTLANPSEFLAQVIDVKAASAVLERFQAGSGGNANPFWQWLNLDMWYRLRVERSYAPDKFVWPKTRVETAGTTTSESKVAM